MCIEREKVNFKSREVNCLKECALALSAPREDAGGFKPRIRPPYPQRVVKGGLNGAPLYSLGR